MTVDVGSVSACVPIGLRLRASDVTHELLLKYGEGRAKCACC